MREKTEFERMLEIIVDILNKEFEFYLTLKKEFNFYIESNNKDFIGKKENFYFKYEIYDSNKAYIIAMSKMFTKNLVVYVLKVYSLLNSKKEFNDIIKAVIRDIIKDLQNSDYITIIPKNKKILNKTINYKNKFFDIYDLLILK